MKSIIIILAVHAYGSGSAIIDDRLIFLLETVNEVASSSESVAVEIERAESYTRGEDELVEQTMTLGVNIA